MIWAAMLGVFVQLWINIEIGRWAIATGESAMTGLARVSRKIIFFFIGAVIGGFTMAVYTPALLYMNLKYLPKSARPKPLNIVMVSIGAVTYISFAVYTVWEKTASWLS